MNKTNTILAVILLVMAGCGGNKQLAGVFITVDVTKNYPKKELILQDFMDIEYIPLETTDEFLCRGIVLDIGKEFILVGGGMVDGDVLFFDRSGKGLRRMNHYGRGGQEYSRQFPSVILDEDNNELVVNDSPTSKIIVYDLFGKFKRSFPYQDGWKYREVYNFNRECLICKDDSFEVDMGDTDNPPFIIVTKQDGSIIKDIHIPFKEKISSTVRVEKDGIMSVAYISRYPIRPSQNSWILNLHSSDTVFWYLADHSMIPFMGRAPSIHSMSSKVFLIPEICTERYYFMKTLKMDPEITGSTLYDREMFFPETQLVYDRQEQTIFECTVFNDDYFSKTSVDMMQKSVNDEIAFVQKLEADALVDAYNKGLLKGKLKEIAAELDEDSNPVLMIVKYKK